MGSPAALQVWVGMSPGRGIALASLLQGVKVHCGIDDAIVQEALAESKEITLER